MGSLPFFISLILLVGVGPTGCKKKDPVLARVGPSVVTASEFQREVQGVPFSSRSYLHSPSGRKELLELLVRRKIIVAEAQSQPLDDSGRHLFAELNKEYGRKKEELRRSYLEEKERLWVSLHTRLLSKGPLKVTDDDIRRYWEREREVRTFHILVSDRGLAEDIRARISRGESFAALAKTYSEDAPDKGGEVGYLLAGSLVPAFENALFAMKEGEVSGVVASPYGFHVIRRGDDRPLSRLPLDDGMKDRIRKAIESQKLQSWFDAARLRHPVSVNTEALTDVVLSTGPAASGR